MSDINEVKARVRRWAEYWISPRFAVSAPTLDPADAMALLADHDRLEAENAELARKAKCFDAMVNKWCVWNSPAAHKWQVTRFFTSTKVLGEGATPIDAVEAAVKALEGK